MCVKVRNALKTAMSVYLILILSVLPLYMQDGYVMIGNVKYLFFRNVTLFFVLVTTVMLIVLMVARGGERKKYGKLSCTDIFVLLYGVSAVLSWCFATDRHKAWWGAPGWYMGLLSQLMFVWIYFAVSEWCTGAKEVSWGFFASALTVMALGVLNRYRFDPLSLSAGLDDWNREHLLSTIGNQNWYCGYISVASAVCIGFACEGDKKQRVAGAVGSVLFFWTILTQGSEGGYLIVLAEMAVIFFRSLTERRKLLAFLGVSACLPVAALLGQYCIRFRGLMLVEDGPLAGLLFRGAWLPALIVIAALIVLLYIREKRGCKDRLKSGKLRKAVLCAAGVLVAGTVIFMACGLREKGRILGEEGQLLHITDSWGNGRGALWRMSLDSFMQESFWKKWIGSGPDCFSDAVYAFWPVEDIMRATGQWEGAFYANAHNEWLNMLINQGVSGLIFYGGIFVTLFVRLWKYGGKAPLVSVGLLAISGYCAYGAVSFQQTVSTPLMFAVLGISEGLLTRENGDLCHRQS